MPQGYYEWLEKIILHLFMIIFWEMRSADDRAQFLRASEDASFNKNVLSRGVAQSAVDGIKNSEVTFDCFF